MAELDGRPATVDEVAALGLANYGHFTTMTVHDGRVRGLELHLDRLVRDARIVFGADLDRDRVRWCVRHALGDASGPVVVRVSVYDPALAIAHPDEATPHVLVTTRPSSAAPAHPLRAMTMAYARDLPAVKHLGLFGVLHCRRTVRQAGFDDALFTAGGLVSEGASWNAGFFDGERIVWPEAEVLHGVTMALLQQAEPHVVAPLGVGELGRMQVAFATNSAVGVRAIGAIDHLEFPATHPVLDRLRAAHAAVPPEKL